MRIERKDVGHGKYQWFRDGKEDHRPEYIIWDWLKTLPYEDKYGRMTAHDRASGDLACEGYIDITI